MPKVYRCIYCDRPALVTKEKGKNYMDCPNCGKLEAKPLLIARLEARAKLELEK